MEDGRLHWFLASPHVDFSYIVSGTVLTTAVVIVLTYEPFWIYWPSLTTVCDSASGTPTLHCATVSTSHSRCFDIKLLYHLDSITIWRKILWESLLSLFWCYRVHLYKAPYVEHDDMWVKMNMNKSLSDLKNVRSGSWNIHQWFEKSLICSVGK